MESTEESQRSRGEISPRQELFPDEYEAIEMIIAGSYITMDLIVIRSSTHNWQKEGF